MRRTLLIIFIFFIVLKTYGMNLDDVLLPALHEDIDVLKNENDKKVNQWELFEAKKAAFPSVSLEFENQTFDDTNVAFTATPQFKQTPELKLNLFAPIYTDGSLSQNIIYKRKQGELLKLSLELTKEQLKHDIIQQYLDVLAKSRKFDISKEILNNAEALLNIYENVFELGKITKLELLNARKEAAKIKYEKELARLDYLKAYNSLMRLSQLDDSRISDLEDINVDMNYNEELEKITEEALKNRLELKVYRLDAEVKKMEKNLTEPKETLGVNLEYSRGGVQRGDKNRTFPLDNKEYKYSLLFSKPLNWHKISYQRDYESIGWVKAGQNLFEDTVLATDRITFDLFDNGVEKSTIARKKADYEYSRLSIRDFKKNMMLNIEDAYNSLMTARETIKIQQQNVAYYEEKIEIENNQYKLGQFSMADLLESIVESLTEKKKYIEAFFDYKKSYIMLKYLSGELSNEKL